MDINTQKALYNICKGYGDVMIVDVMNYLHRFMWVHKDMSVDINGEVVCSGHLFGFTRFINFLKEKFPGCSVILALDGNDTERREINKEYKAQREHTYRVDKEMQELLSMCGLHDGVFVGYDSTMEADDVIYAVSKKVNELCIKNGIEKNIYIMSNDKDMFQCVTKTTPSSIKIIRKFGSGKDWFSDAEVVDYEGVKSKFEGVCPENLVKYRAIVGDSSDNLKGYYRFRKANAAQIAEKFSVTPDRLVANEGALVGNALTDAVGVINGEYKTFWNNYNIMRLKDFDFALEFISGSDIKEGASSVAKYRLNMYRAGVCRVSPYRESIMSVLVGLGF